MNSSSQGAVLDSTAQHSAGVVVPDRLRASVLESAALLIERPGAWTRSSTARRPWDATSDYPCFATDERARSWGALGAIYKVGRAANLSNQQCYELGRQVAAHVGARYLTDWNGHQARTPQEVAAAFRAVIATGADQ